MKQILAEPFRGIKINKIINFAFNHKCLPNIDSVYINIAHKVNISPESQGYLLYYKSLN